MKTCHGCDGKGKMESAGNATDIECPVCGGTGTLPDTYSIEIAQNSPHLCPACAQERTEPPLGDCPKGSHYGEYCPV